MITPRTNFADVPRGDLSHAVADAAADSAIKAGAHIMAANLDWDMASDGEVCRAIAHGLLSAAVHWAYAACLSREADPSLGPFLREQVDHRLALFRDQDELARHAFAVAMAGTPLPAALAAFKPPAGRA